MDGTKERFTARRRTAFLVGVGLLTAISVVLEGLGVPGKGSGAFGAPLGSGSLIARPSHRTPVSPLRGTRGETDEDETLGGSGPSGSSSDYMFYRGGWIQESPRLYLLLWGDWSMSSDRYGVAARLQIFLQNVGGSAWARTLTQYGYNCTVNGMSCPNGVMAKNPTGQYRGLWTDTSTVPVTPSKADLNAEAVRFANAVGDYSHNAQYVIALPPGHDDYRFVTKMSNGVCGWHDWAAMNMGDAHAVSYTSMSYMPDAGDNHCGNNSVTGNTLDGVTVIESHEYAEAVTNPFVKTDSRGTYEGWDDSTFGSGEIGDKCNWGGGTSYRSLQTFGSYRFPVQALWSNYYRYYSPYWGCQFAG
jgi:serine protease